MRRPRIRLHCLVTGDVLLIDVASLVAVRECKYRNEARVILRGGIDFWVRETLSEVEAALDRGEAECDAPT